MFLRRHAITAIALLITAFLLAGCGQLSKKDYEKRVEKIGKKTEQQLDTVFTGDKPPSPADLRDARDVFDTSANELDEINPPKDVEKAHEQFVDGLNGLSGAFGRLAERLDNAKTDEDKAKIFVEMGSDSRAATAFEDLSKAEKAFRKKKYTIFATS